MIRVACTALLKRIVAGSPNKDGTALVGGGDDVTGDCLKATAELIGAGNSITLKIKGVDAYVIAVKAVEDAKQEPQPVQAQVAPAGWFVKRSEFGLWIEVEQQEPGAEQFYRIAAQPESGGEA